MFSKNIAINRYVNGSGPIPGGYGHCISSFAGVNHVGGGVDANIVNVVLPDSFREFSRDFSIDHDLD